MPTVKVQTESKISIVNVTDIVREQVADIAEGIAIITVPHTTCALIISEDDQQLREDFIKVCERWLEDLRPFKHIRRNNPNTEAHILSAFGGTSVLLAIDKGDLQLGNFQNILLLELDGPKTRKINCRFLNLPEA
jgi:secondary thiamine-phosphate synthase enzyme